MIAGVKAIVLAAATASATAALPFTPPAGWAQLPQSAVNVSTSAWSGPKAANGAQATFGTVVFPFPGTVDMLATKPPQNMASSGLLTQISSVPVNLCGTPGRLITSRTQANGKTAYLQREVAVKDGYAYMLAYTRSANAAPDARIVQLMRNFCPSGTSQVPKPAMPAGWTKAGSDLQMDGIWMGTHPGQIMILMHGTQMKSLDELFSSARQQSVKAPSGKNVVTIGPRKSVSLCGYPGMLVDMNVNIAPMPAAIHMALTQGAGKSYVLLYTDVGRTAADQAALASLQTLCATGAAAPSPSASPSPSPTPSA